MKLKTQDEYLSEIFKQVAEKHEIDQKYVEDMYDHFFRTTKQILKNPSVSNIVIPKWGSFTPTLHKVNVEIRRVLRKYQRGSITKERASYEISYFWSIRQDLMKEENYRKKNDKRYGRKA